MKKLTLLGFICLALMLTALPFAACAEPTPPPPGAPTVITPTPAIVTPSPAPAAPTAPVAVVPAPVTPVGPAAPVTPAPAPVVVTAPAGEPVFTVLDPRSYQEPWELQGITPRLDTLEGKSIVVVNLHGGNEAAIISVGPALQAAVPGCNVQSLSVEGFWSLSKDEKSWILDNFDGAIFGHDY